MKLKLTIAILILTCLSHSSFAQKLNYEKSENAGKMFNLKNYERAKELYRIKYKKDYSNMKVKYRFGVCLIYTYEMEDGIKHIEGTTSDPATPPEAWYHMARGYHLSNRYDKAISLYNKYISLENTKEELVKRAKRNVEMCYNAKMIIKKPLNITFENLGKRVNSAGRDYLPIITPDESMLIFTTRREGTTGRIFDLEGYHTADIYITKYKYGKWSRSRSIGAPNKYGNEQTAGISGNGQYIMYYVNNPMSPNNLQISTKTRSSYKRSIKFTPVINNGLFLQTSATISDDGNYLIFSSDRPGGFGRQDLYISRKLPNGEWGTPENMGNVLNTDLDEAYPYLSDDGNTIHFASTGHNSIGGYDIFVSHFDLRTKEWSKPRNLGYPLNTPYNNTNISFTKNKKYAYVSAYRKDSYGGQDIYKVDFVDTPPDYTTFKGKVMKADSVPFNIPLTVEVFDKATEELYGLYEVNPENGKYIMILPPGQYELNIDIPGKGYWKKLFGVEGRNKYRKETKRHIVVSFDEPAEPDK